MTPEEKALLENTLTLVKENNEILRSIRRTSRISTALKIFYWVLIIGLSLGAFYFIQPYVDLIRGGGGTDNAITNQAQQLQDLLKP
jgi:TRAP-type C4-dicarboxylate transport system permease small subunit